MDIMFTWKNEERIFKVFHAGMGALFILIITFAAAQPGQEWLAITGLTLVYATLTVFRHLYLSNRQPSIAQWVLPYIEAFVLYILAVNTGSYGFSAFILIIWDVSIDYKTEYGIVFTLVAFSVYMQQALASAPPELAMMGQVHMFMIGLFQIAIYVGFAFTAKNYSIQSKNLKKTTAELHAKMIATEQMTVLQERNRIAAEIHNTVGHQLTTALVQIEAAQLLQAKDSKQVSERLEIIKQQVRTGLQEIRKAIDAINADHEYEDFQATVNRLLAQVEMHTKVQIHQTIEDISGVKLALRKTLYHVILEAITNAIRHGQAHIIAIELQNQDRKIRLSVFNDGLVPNTITYGYGLTHIREQIQAVEGSLMLKMNEHDWFGLVVEIPLFHQERDRDGQNQSHVS